MTKVCVQEAATPKYLAEPVTGARSGEALLQPNSKESYVANEPRMQADGFILANAS